ncbi:MAG TPA: MASE1 domain-containing protein [Terriglobia bacterium]
MTDAHQPRVAAASRFIRDWQANQARPPRLKYAAVLVAVAGAHVYSGTLALRLALVPPSSTPIWPPAGIALAAFLLFGFRVWPAVFAGALMLNLTTVGSVLTANGIAIGNTAAALVGAYLVERYAGGMAVFRKTSTVFRFALLAGMVSTTIGATIGATCLAAAGFVEWSHYLPLWLTWWLGDMAGNVIVAPILLIGFVGPRSRWNRHKLLEALALALYLFLVGITAFGELFLPETRNYPLEFLCIPFLIWAAFRLGQMEAALALLLLSGISIWSTLQGYGPFVRKTPGESLLLLQAFMGVVGVMTHSMAAVVAERRAVEKELREARDELSEQAISDPLTSLANYRRFVDVFNAEADRSLRTGRPFALVLFDLDGLKRINDEYGHLVGSQALIRVGNTLRVYCRAIDTAVRYGGDEFALLLPETQLEGALPVAKRIAQQVASDGEQPHITVSLGIAVYPGDGRTLEAVFGKADAALYRMKRGGGWKQVHLV